MTTIFSTTKSYRQRLKKAVCEASRRQLNANCRQLRSFPFRRLRKLLSCRQLTNSFQKLTFLPFFLVSGDK